MELRLRTPDSQKIANEIANCELRIANGKLRMKLRTKLRMRKFKMS